MAGQIKIEIDEKKLIELVREYCENILGSLGLEDKDIEIQTKSSQNYRSEWERANFKAVINKNI